MTFRPLERIKGRSKLFGTVKRVKLPFFVFGIQHPSLSFAVTSRLRRAVAAETVRIALARRAERQDVGASTMGRSFGLIAVLAACLALQLGTAEAQPGAFAMLFSACPCAACAASRSVRALPNDYA